MGTRHHSMGREARPPRIPLLRYSAEAALHEVAEGGKVRAMKAGTAEVLGGKSGEEAYGYLMKASLALYLKLGGQVTED